MILGQVAPIPHIVFVIAFIQTKQRKQNENQASLVQYTFPGHTAQYTTGDAMTSVWGTGSV